MAGSDGVPLSDARLETLLAAAFAPGPTSAGLAHMDGRVAAAIALRRSGSVRPARRVLRWPLPLPQRLRPLALLLAAGALVGAGAAYLGLFEPIVSPVEGWQLGFDRAAQPAITQVAGPYRLTLERAYADANQVLVGVRVIEGAGATHVEFGPNPTLTDAGGVHCDAYFASGYPNGNANGWVFGFLPETPFAPGRHEFTLTIELVVSAHDAYVGPSPGATFTPMPAPLTFHFAADVGSGGVVVTPGTAVTASRYTLTLESASVSPTMVRGRLAVTGPDVANLDPIGTMTLDGRTLPLQALPAAADPGSWLFELTTLAGSDHPSGTLVVRIDALTGTGTDNPAIRVEGPWTFSMPLGGNSP
jgi:hypothetical protein